ncbi:MULTISPECIES: hypothetical protein [unclassified Bacillus (in: firmicutes)]|uniref:hypothetical protein n=1 Tax=unclassified Bacillus (in: firmicutes) TaxID=185979 RepID=UPI00301014F1
MKIEEIEKIIFDWHERSIGAKNDESSTEFDEKWTKVFEELQNNNDELKDLIVEPETLLFRVHTGGNDEPQRTDYDDQPTYPKVFEEAHKNWRTDNNVKAIDFNNHWSSFTKSTDVIGSAYFAEKGLRGFVIVVLSDKAVDISSRVAKKGVFDEQEVVAPMDEKTVIDKLPFKDFMKKYGEKETEKI